MTNVPPLPACPSPDTPPPPHIPPPHIPPPHTTTSSPPLPFPPPFLGSYNAQIPQGEKNQKSNHRRNNNLIPFLSSPYSFHQIPNGGKPGQHTAGHSGTGTQQRPPLLRHAGVCRFGLVHDVFPLLRGFRQQSPFPQQLIPGRVVRFVVGRVVGTKQVPFLFFALYVALQFGKIHFARVKNIVVTGQRLSTGPPFHGHRLHGFQHPGETIDGGIDLVQQFGFLVVALVFGVDRGGGGGGGGGGVVAVVVVVRVFFQAVNAPAQIHFGAPCFSSHLVPPVTHGSGGEEVGVGARGKREGGGALDVEGSGGGRRGTRRDWLFANHGQQSLFSSHFL